jgi:hypothetical protein
MFKSKRISAINYLNSQRLLVASSLLILAFIILSILPVTHKSDLASTIFTLPRITRAAAQSCISSGDPDDIVDALIGSDEAILCPNTTFNLTYPIIMSAGQKIYTQGNPTDYTRALLKIVNDSYSDPLDTSPVTRKLTTAIWARKRVGEGGNPSFDDIEIHHIRIDGNRPGLGLVTDQEGGAELIGMGGNSEGQKIHHVKAYEPRGWTIIHAFGGDGCTDVTVEYNEIGPAGHSEGSWADGISFACPNSSVRYNTITDATGGSLVIFGAADSTISDNIIEAKNRTVLGGIGMVDTGCGAPHPTDISGCTPSFNYSGLTVSNNIIRAAGAQIRVAMPVGSRLHHCGGGNISSATISNNVLQGAYMGYGIAASGATFSTVSGNSSTAAHNGLPTIGCTGATTNQLSYNPSGLTGDAPAAFQANTSTTSGFTSPPFQNAGLTSRVTGLEPPSTWRMWAHIPGDGTSSRPPDTTLDSSGGLHLAVLGGGNTIYTSKPNYSTYTSGWQGIPSATPTPAPSPAPSPWTPSRPAIVTDGNGDLRVYVSYLGSSDNIYRNIGSWNSGSSTYSWNGWQKVNGGGTTLNPPEAVFFDSKVYLLVRGTDDKIYARDDTNTGQTHSWGELAGSGLTSSSPAAAASSNKLYVAVRGTNNKAYVNTFTGTMATSSGWTTYDGDTTSEPGIAVDSNGDVSLFITQGADNRIYEGTITTSTSAWSGWAVLTPEMVSPYGIGAIKDSSGIRLFTSGFTNQLWSIPLGEPFTDVDKTNPYYQDIMRIRQLRVTIGCTSTQYCPDSYVTREQMAAFIMRALGEVNPPAPPSQRFTDVHSDNVFYAFIDRLAVLGITTGCNPPSLTQYCPGDNVTHAQMAVFMSRAKGFFNPDLSTVQHFDDVPIGSMGVGQHWAFRWIEHYGYIRQVWTGGDGCDEGSFCPESYVTRQQMARILVNNFGL